MSHLTVWIEWPFERMYSIYFSSNLQGFLLVEGFLVLCCKTCSCTWLAQPRIALELSAGQTITHFCTKNEEIKNMLADSVYEITRPRNIWNPCSQVLSNQYGELGTSTTDGLLKSTKINYVTRKIKTNQVWC